MADNENDSKTTVLYSPWGTKVHVASEDADTMKEAGFSTTKPKSA